MSNKIIRHRHAPDMLSPFDGGLRDFWGDFWNFPSLFGDHPLGEFSAPSVFHPRMDIQEKENEFLAEVELPGFDHEDIQVEVEDNALILSGERSESKEKKEGNYLRNERTCGSFYQKLNFPNSANLEATTCHSKNGVLSLTIPKKEGSKNKKIKVELLK